VERIFDLEKYESEQVCRRIGSVTALDGLYKVITTTSAIVCILARPRM
jgi:hypothetical protein